MSGIGFPNFPFGGVNPPQAPDPIAQAHAEHAQAKARFEKVQQSAQRLGAVRLELDKLSSMGDVISPDDVIDAAARLVGHGLGSRAMAGLLAGMPQNGGQALAQWVQARDQQVRMREQAMAQVMPVARHQLGVAAMRSLAGRALEGPPQGSSPSDGAQEGASSPGLAPADSSMSNDLSPMTSPI